MLYAFDAKHTKPCRKAETLVPNMAAAKPAGVEQFDDSWLAAAATFK